MRIISGSHRGRKINPPVNLPVRPTTDRAKEALFNILYNYYDFDRVNFLDLFAGTGNISYEFASRGCMDILAIDINPRCIDFINNTARKLDFTMIKTIQGNVMNILPKINQKFDIIFADPPYDFGDTGLLANKIFEEELLRDEGMLIIEHSRDIDFSSNKNFFDQRKYSKVNFSFFTPRQAG